MSPEAQRITIAEVCGWEPDMSPETELLPYCTWKRPDGSGMVVREDALPDYLSDLNAMNEVTTNHLTHVQAILIRGGATQVEAVVLSIDATAAQRAEAFLRTIGKWDGSK